MLRNIVVLIIVLAIVGLVVGYFLFAKQGDGYIPVERLLGISRGTALERSITKIGQAIGDALTGVNVQQVRAKILYAGIAGAVIGLVIGVASYPRRRRR